jgi:transcriptional regulator with XRE-family HTH domain
MTTVGDYVRELRGNLSQHQLAQLVGVSDGAIALIERGHRALSDGLAERICVALDVTAGQRARLAVLRLSERAARLQAELDGLTREIDEHSAIADGDA